MCVFCCQVRCVLLVRPVSFSMSLVSQDGNPVLDTLGPKFGMDSGSSDDEFFELYFSQCSFFSKSVCGLRGVNRLFDY